MLSKIYLKIRSAAFPSIELYIKKLMKNYNSFVDLGCGPNSPVQILNKIKQFNSLGVDGSKESIEESKIKNIHANYLQSKILETKLKSKSYDVAISLDVLNLQSKDDGFKLIKEMERIASKRVIILVPNGKIEEPDEIKLLSESKYKSNYDFLKWRSTWTADEMRKLGYEVVGINGLKFLKKANASPRIKPSFLGVLISDFTQLFTVFFPSKAFHLLCYKDLNKNEK